MGPGRDPPGDLHVNGPLLYPARRKSPMHTIHQPFQVDRPELKLLEASPQPRQVFEL